MMCKRYIAIYLFGLSVSCTVTFADTTAEVKVNVRHSVGGISTFDREKFMNVHSSLSEPDWMGEEDKLQTLVDEWDVSFGRDNGSMLLYFAQAHEDPVRPGYADPDYMTVAGRLHRNIDYGERLAHRHQYDHKNEVMIGGQTRTFWYGQSNGGNDRGWPIAGPDAMGEFMGRFLNDFYRDAGEPPTKGPARPKYLEVVNEPLYALMDGRKENKADPIEIFRFHNEVAAGVRKVNDSVLIGGYTAAFPIFEERDFARWDERMKLFLDTCGKQMDFLSVHFYDFNNRGDRGRDDYKGARLEATFDMMEQYSQIRLGEVKPFIISEYGGRDHTLENRPWTALRDWHFLKAATPLTLSFLDRPNLILKSIPFITAKAEWGRKNGVPYNRRLLHQAKERPGMEGEDWQFTDLALFYELWSDVNGTRVKTSADNADVLIDAYVAGDKMYMILSNLNPAEEQVELLLLDSGATEVDSLKVKKLYRMGDAAAFLVHESSGALKSIKLPPEASAILEYRFKGNINIDQEVKERKHYATEYNKPIHGGQELLFNVNGLHLGGAEDAVLRIGLGREKQLSRQPTVSFNGQALAVPTNYSGSDQATRPAFFGLLEIPVSAAQLKSDNEISIVFSDSGGRVSSVTLRTFN